MKKVLALVLSCEAPPYDKLMQTSIDTWDSRQVEGIETVFYCGRSKTKQSNDKIIYLNTEDSFLTMGAKTIEAFEWALNNKQFDYLARPNASCYVRKKQLLDFCQNLPSEKLFLGLKVQSVYNIDYLWGGGQCILSRDVVELMVKNKNEWNHNYTEDVSMADLASRLGIELNGNGYACSINMKPDRSYTCITYGDKGEASIDSNDISDMSKLSNQFFIRIKQDSNRQLDIEIMNNLFKSGI